MDNVTLGIVKKIFNYENTDGGHWSVSVKSVFCVLGGSERRPERWKTGAENTHCRGEGCTAVRLVYRFYSFVPIWYFLVWSNPNQLNWRPALRLTNTSPGGFCINTEIGIVRSLCVNATIHCGICRPLCLVWMSLYSHPFLLSRVISNQGDNF